MYIKKLKYKKNTVKHLKTKNSVKFKKIYYKTCRKHKI